MNKQFYTGWNTSGLLGGGSGGGGGVTSITGGSGLSGGTITTTGTLAVRFAVQNLAAPGAITGWDTTVLVTGSGAVTLPTINAASTGKWIYLYNSGGGTVSVALTSGTITMYQAGDSIVVGNDGTNSFELADTNLNAPFTTQNTTGTLASGQPQSVLASPAAATPITITLPAPSATISGNTISITKIDSDATSIVTVAGAIVGGSIPISTQGGSVLLRNDGGSWYPIAKPGSSGSATTYYQAGAVFVGSTPLTITHSLNLTTPKAILVQTIDSSTGDYVYGTLSNWTANSVDITMLAGVTADVTII